MKPLYPVHCETLMLTHSQMKVNRSHEFFIAFLVLRCAQILLTGNLANLHDWVFMSNTPSNYSGFLHEVCGFHGHKGT